MARGQLVWLQTKSETDGTMILSTHRRGHRHRLARSSLAAKARRYAMSSIAIHENSAPHIKQPKLSPNPCSTRPSGHTTMGTSLPYWRASSNVARLNSTRRPSYTIPSASHFFSSFIHASQPRMVYLRQFPVDIAAPCLANRKDPARTVRTFANPSEEGEIVLGEHRVPVILLELVAMDRNAGEEIVPDEALLEPDGGHGCCCAWHVRLSITGFLPEGAVHRLNLVSH